MMWGAGSTLMLRLEALIEHSGIKLKLEVGGHGAGYDQDTRKLSNNE